MRKSELAYTIEIILIIMLFFSILVLMLNSFLPTVILKNPGDPDELIYFNLESMKYSQNINIQNFCNDINLINNLIWITIIITFIAFFGVIINISKIYKKISYLFLSIGCLSIIFSSISCYLYIIFNFKIINFDDILLAYIIIEPFRYAYIIFIILIIIIIFSTAYNFIITPILFRAFKDVKSKKQELTIEKSFTKPVERINVIKNKKEDINMDFYFKEINGFAKNMVSNERNIIETKDELDKNYIKKETKDEQIATDKNGKYLDEKKSPCLKKNEKEKPKQNKDETDEVKLSEPLEKALFSAIDKMKKRRS